MLVTHPLSFCSWHMLSIELRGSPLMFVLKLDEAEILEFEHMSLTLMNRALDPEIQKDDARYFSVQSDQEIWPIGCF